MPTPREKLRAMTRGAYDLQKLRIQSGLRLCANFRSRLGLEPGAKEDEDEDAGKVLDALRESFRRLTDGIARHRTLPARKGFVGDDLISEYSELILVKHYLDLEKAEAAHFRDLAAVLADFRIYNEFLLGVVGIGPAMAAVLISEIDIAKARYVSSLWKYAGIDVAPDGRGRSRRKEHLVRRTYIDKDGVEAERDSVTFNPFLKTKLTGVLAGSFLRSRSPYADIYAGYKHRLETDPARAEMTKLHRHNAAMRYMIKIFLGDLYNRWRGIEGLPVAPTYAEGKLGLKHGESAA